MKSFNKHGFGPMIGIQQVALPMADLDDDAVAPADALDEAAVAPIGPEGGPVAGRNGRRGVFAKSNSVELSGEPCANFGFQTDFGSLPKGRKRNSAAMGSGGEGRAPRRASTCGHSHGTGGRGSRVREVSPAFACEEAPSPSGNGLDASKVDMRDAALLRLYELLTAKGAAAEGSFASLDAAGRREYFRLSRRQSRARERAARAAGNLQPTVANIRDVLADAALMILATQAPGVDQVRLVLGTAFARRPGVPVSVEQRARTGRLRVKTIEAASR